MATWGWLRCRSGSGGCRRLSPFGGRPAAAPRESWRTAAGAPRAVSRQCSPLGGWPATAEKPGPASVGEQARTMCQPVVALVSACGACIAPGAVVVGALPVQFCALGGSLPGVGVHLPNVAFTCGAWRRCGRPRRGATRRPGRARFYPRRPVRTCVPVAALFLVFHVGGLVGACLRRTEEAIAWGLHFAAVPLVWTPS